MKLTAFSRLALLAFAAVLLVSVGGRVLTESGAAALCDGWPLCVPQGGPGWLALLHRAGVLIASALMLMLLSRAWRDLRDQRLLLPLATLTVVTYFAQAFLGAVQTARGLPDYLTALHALTAVALWIGLGALAVFAVLLRPVTVAFPPIDWRQRAMDFLTLTKPVVVLLLLATTFAGMVAGGRQWPSIGLAFWTLLGGALAAGGSSALNQYIDRDLDKNMQRTAKRPLAAGRMTPAEGLSFGLALVVISFYLLAALVNLPAALLSLAGAIYYVILYSILLKKATVQNIVIGGGAGAIPPLVGWAAATGGLNIPALFLFAIVFLWTPPHFWALAIVRRKDYEQAGVPMLPVIKGEKAARAQILIYTAQLVALTVLMPLLGMAGTVFLAAALALGAWLLYAAWNLYRTEGNKVAWKMYRYSSMYLLFLFAALMVDALV